MILDLRVAPPVEITALDLAVPDHGHALDHITILERAATGSPAA